MSNTAYAGQFRNTIIMMNPDGTNRRVVLDEPGKNLLAPVWSPAGDTIAFNFVESGGLFAGTRNNAPAHIAIAAADGSGMRILTSGPGNFAFPSWSPDGKRLVARHQGPHHHRCRTGARTQLTSGPFVDNFPAWSPTRDLILFTSDRDGDRELYTIRSDGTRLTRLTHSPANDAHATWSFDGEWIAFAAPAAVSRTRCRWGRAADTVPATSSSCAATDRTSVR